MQEIKNQIINPIEDGGAPFYGSDILTVQENAKTATVALAESTRQFLGGFDRRNAAGDVIETVSNGLWLKKPEIINAGNGSTETIIGDGYFIADGEVVYYAGGNIGNIQGASRLNGRTLWLGLDPTEAKEARVFKDGVSKEFTVTREAKSFGLGNVSNLAHSYPAGIDKSNQFVLVTFGGDSYPDLKDCVNSYEQDSKISTLEQKVQALEQVENVLETFEVKAEDLPADVVLNGGYLKFFLLNSGQVIGRGSLFTTAAKTSDTVLFKFPSSMNNNDQRATFTNCSDLSPYNNFDSHDASTQTSFDGTLTLKIYPTTNFEGVITFDDFNRYIR